VAINCVMIEVSRISLPHHMKAVSSEHLVS
jgi:hypothetical protein